MDQKSFRSHIQEKVREKIENPKYTTKIRERPSIHELDKASLTTHFHSHLMIYIGIEDREINDMIDDLVGKVVINRWKM